MQCLWAFESDNLAFFIILLIVYNCSSTHFQGYSLGNSTLKENSNIHKKYESQHFQYKSQYFVEVLAIFIVFLRNFLFLQNEAVRFICDVFVLYCLWCVLVFNNLTDQFPVKFFSLYLECNGLRNTLVFQISCWFSKKLPSRFNLIKPFKFHQF